MMDKAETMKTELIRHNLGHAAVRKETQMMSSFS